MLRKRFSVSELRQDIVSGDWVVIATARARRPHDFFKEKRPAFIQPRSGCPFETLHRDALLAYSLDGAGGKENWHVQVIPNKYPAFSRGRSAAFRKTGPYQAADGIGFHEVVVTRDHRRSIAEQSPEETELVLRAYQERYLAIKADDSVVYISVFHNHGREAGATIYHPHSQIIATPVIPPDVGRSIRGSADYFHKYKECVHCTALYFELRVEDRVVYQNRRFAVIAPFASKTAFELRIFPKKHGAHFETIAPAERLALAEALGTALAKLSKGLRNPDYNFFLHTAPAGHPGEPRSQRAADHREFDHYHWHFEILPKTAIWAGFEIGTGIEISTISPEAAAEFLRKIEV